MIRMLTLSVMFMMIVPCVIMVQSAWRVSKDIRRRQAFLKRDVNVFILSMTAYFVLGMMLLFIRSFA